MRIPLILFDVLAFIVCCLGFVQIQTRPGLPLTVADRNDTVFCTGVTHEWFAHTLTPGEAILSFNGQQLAHTDDLEFMLDGCRVGDTVTLRVAGPGGVRLEHPQLTHFYGPFYLFSVVLVSMLFFVIGLVVRWKKPDDPAARVYHAGSIATAMQLCTTWGTFTTLPPYISVALRVVFTITYAFIPVMFFHLTHLFPRPRRAMFRGALPLLYLAAAVLAAGSGASFVRAWSAGSVESFHLHLAWFNATRVFLIVLVFAGLWVFYRSYVRAGEEPERRKLRWVLWGMFVGFLPFVVLWVVPSLVLSYGLVPESVMLLASAFIPLAFGISIVRYHIMDIDLLLNRSLVYGTVMGLVVIVYIGVVGAVAMALTQAMYTVSLGLSIGAAIVVALLFEPTRRAVQHLVDRRFFRVQYDYRRAARRFQDDMKTCITIEDLGQLIVERVDALVPVQGIGFYIADGTDTMQPVACQGLVHGDPHLVLALRKQLDEAGGTAVARGEALEAGIAFREADEISFGAWGIALAWPVLRSDNRLLGMLLLGPKMAGTRFTSEDQDLLSTMTTQGGREMERILLQRAVLEKEDEAGRFQKLNALKSDFVSYVSHELRTPLTSIKMFAELLDGHLPRADRRAREYAGIISGEAERLQRMVNTILDSARIDHGEEQYQMRKVRLDLLLKDVLRTMKYQIAKEKFRVTLDIAGDRNRRAPGKYVANADPDAVREAILNLLTNAMKYSGDSRKIRIVLRRTRVAIMCSVEDYGRGIPVEVLPRLFEKFYRDPSLPARVQGMGLGLSVVKNVMEAHQGQVEVRSTPGEGSTFTLVFPLPGGTAKSPQAV